MLRVWTSCPGWLLLGPCGLPVRAHGWDPVLHERCRWAALACLLPCWASGFWTSGARYVDLYGVQACSSSWILHLRNDDGRGIRGADVDISCLICKFHLFRRSSKIMNNMSVSIVSMSYSQRDAPNIYLRLVYRIQYFNIFYCPISV